MIFVFEVSDWLAHAFLGMLWGLGMATLLWIASKTVELRRKNK